MDRNIPVTFKTRYGLYNAGETAGFAPAVAAKLVETGVADAYEPVAQVTSEDEPSTNVDLELMTVVQLKQLAQERNITLKAGLNKAEIIEVLRIALEIE